MIILLSPAKTLDLDTYVDKTMVSNYIFEREAVEIISSVKKQSKEDLSRLMKISDKLANLNYHRFQNWCSSPDLHQVGHAVFMFKGEVYLGLSANAFNSDNLHFSQNHLRILSGLYGYLAPMDLIQPYRLEMGTKIRIGTYQDLYSFWGDKILNAIKIELSSHICKMVVNLASIEYAKAANLKGLEGNVITPIFKDYKNGTYKVISFFAKKARGVLARWMIENKIERPEDILEFSENGYVYNAELSKTNMPVFTRL